MRQEIEDSRKWRVSMSGFSIKTGDGIDKEIIARYPGAMKPLDRDTYQNWLEQAERVCQRHNETLTPNVQIQGAEPQAKAPAGMPG